MSKSYTSYCTDLRPPAVYPESGGKKIRHWQSVYHYLLSRCYASENLSFVSPVPVLYNKYTVEPKSRFSSVTLSNSPELC
jgi:hypothetical protein